MKTRAAVGTVLFLAWLAYIRHPGIPAAFIGQFSVLHNFLFRKW